MADVRFVKLVNGDLYLHDESNDSLKVKGITVNDINGSGTIILNGKSVPSGDPSVDLDLTTKKYVDAVVSTAMQGLDQKDSVVVASTQEYTEVSSTAYDLVLDTDTVDGKTFTSSDTGRRILLKNQDSNKSHNGIYVIAGVDESNHQLLLNRANDFDGTPPITPAASVYVEEGAVNKNRWFVLAAESDSDGDGVVQIGTDDIIWYLYGSVTEIQAGDALTKTGVTLSVNVDGSTVEVNGSDALQIVDGGVTAVKLNNDVIDTDSGLKFDTTSHAIQVNVDGSSIVFGTSGELKAVVNTSTITDKSVTGDKLADSVAGDGLVFDTNSPRTLNINADNSSLIIDSDVLKVNTSGIKASHIDFGLNASQVHASLIPIEDTSGNYNATNVEDALAEIAGKIGEGEYFKTFHTPSGDVLADGTADTINFASSTLDISGNDSTDTLTFDISDNAVTVEKLATSIDASSKGFNADKVDGKDASAFLWLSGGNNTMSQDLDMNGYDIINIGNDSLTFENGAKITSARFDENGNINATTLEGASLDTSSIIPKSDTIFTSSQVAKRIYNSAKVFSIRKIITDDDSSFPSTSVEGLQVIIDPEMDSPPTGFNAGDIIEYQNSQWVTIFNVLQPKANGTILYLVDNEDGQPEVDVVMYDFDTHETSIESITSLSDTEANHVFINSDLEFLQSNQTIKNFHLQDDDIYEESVLSQIQLRNGFFLGNKGDLPSSFESILAITATSTGYELADKTAANGRYKVIGILAPTRNDQCWWCVTDGIYWLKGMSLPGNIGDPLYLGSNGALSTVAPTASGEVCVRIGYKLADDKLRVDISSPIIL